MFLTEWAHRGRETETSDEKKQRGWLLIQQTHVSRSGPQGGGQSRGAAGIKEASPSHWWIGDLKRFAEKTVR